MLIGTVTLPLCNILHRLWLNFRTSQTIAASPYVVCRRQTTSPARELRRPKSAGRRGILWTFDKMR
jgi:hypothetical protein